MTNEQAHMRSFEDKLAARSNTPVYIGLVGPSSAGKTYSALRLATGIQKVTGGDIFSIDTESRRMLHYADRFKFRHLEFSAPFSPLDYLAAIEHCTKKGAKTIIIDSMSHEHEGPGGMLEMHAAEIERMAGDDWKKADRVKMLAWVKPKAARTRLINTVLQLGVSCVFCFRAKRKTKPVKGGDPIDLGWQPIAGSEFMFEQTVKCLLLPNSGGVPTWQSANESEQEMIKLPEQFRELFAKRQPLSEDIGEMLARWASGEDISSKPALFTKMLSDIMACNAAADFEPLVAKMKEISDKKSLSGNLFVELRNAWKVRQDTIRRAEEETVNDADDSEVTRGTT